MAISYAHSLHDRTSFTIIQKNDHMIDMAWKIPTGRILAATTFSFALIEALFATLLTAVSTPLYPFSERPLKTFSSETIDATKTIGRATKRFVGLDFPTQAPPPRPAKIAPKAPPRSLEPKKVSLLSMAGQFALKHPNTLLVVSALAVAAAGAYFFGYLGGSDFPPSNTQLTIWEPNTKDICLLSEKPDITHSPNAFDSNESKIFNYSTNTSNYYDEPIWKKALNQIKNINTNFELMTRT